VQSKTSRVDKVRFTQRFYSSYKKKKASQICNLFGVIFIFQMPWRVSSFFAQRSHVDGFVNIPAAAILFIVLTPRFGRSF